MLSIRTSIRYIIALMGMLGIALVLVSVNWYRDLVFDEQRFSMSVLGENFVAEQLDHHESYLRDLAQTLQSTPDFRNALNSGGKAELLALINDQFHQYFTTTGLVDLKKIIIFDTSFNTILESNAYAALNEGEGRCNKLIEEAKNRTGAQRLKTVASLCRYKEYPMHMVIVPIGGLRISGYMAAIADPVNAIKSAENNLNMPFRITNISGDVAYQSPEWLSHNDDNNLLLADYHAQGSAGEELFTVTVASDVASLNQHLKKVTFGIILITLVITLTAIAITMTILNRTITAPLSNLISHMQRVRINRAVLQEKIEEIGCKELHKLSQEFNEMTDRLHDMQQILEDRAHTDELTGLPNRTLLYGRLDQVYELSRRHGNKFTIFMTDLDKFKEVNDTMGHHAGDELLKQIGERFRLRCRSSDTVSRFGGDEFAILLPDINDRESAINFAKTLSEVVEQPYEIDGREIAIGLSIGIAIYPDNASDPDMLMRCADKGMYHAKKNKLGYFFCEENCHQMDHAPPRCNQ
jgi:diguanylate cyclase (GGDEF)-like protein